jgi:trimethylamine:corrinoid methyltransferase-like protein
VRHFRQELLLPGPLWTRQTFEGWRGDGATSMGDRARAKVRELLDGPPTEALEPGLERELDRIVAAASGALVA